MTDGNEKHNHILQKHVTLYHSTESGSGNGAEHVPDSSNLLPTEPRFQHIFELYGGMLDTRKSQHTSGY